MLKRLVLSYVVSFIAFGGLVIASGVIQLPKSPNLYSSGTPFIGRTNLDGGTGCSCHNAGATTAITGPAQLYPGQSGTYTVTINSAAPDGSRMGMNVKATGGTLSVSSAALIVDTGEIRHRASPATLNTLSGGTASYQFAYQMSGASVPSTDYTIAAVAAAGYGGQWGPAPNKTVTAIRPANPSGFSAGAPGSTSIPISWTGSGPEYRVVYKTTGTPSSPTDGTTVDVTNPSTTVNGLSSSTTYYFAVYARATFSATNTFSSSATSGSATTTGPKTWYVDAGAGNDSNPGTANSPLQSVKVAMNNAGDGDTILVAPGTYAASFNNNEFFPIDVKSGVKLKSSGGAAVTILDATSMDTVYGSRGRLFECSGNSSTTLIQGFTLTGGRSVGNTTAQGGAIFTHNNDATVIDRNIFTGNEAHGLNGTQFVMDGGASYGGAIYADGPNLITNNLFINNVASGGTGYGANPAGSGGEASGGGVYLYGPATLANNTFHRPSPIRSARSARY